MLGYLYRIVILTYANLQAPFTIILTDTST
jgi:hypothetical protein